MVADLCEILTQAIPQNDNTRCPHYRPFAIGRTIATPVCPCRQTTCNALLLYAVLQKLTMGQHVNAILSIGGWTGSQYFSSAVATDANRTAFAQTVMKTVNKYNLSGVEFECACFLPFKSRLLINQSSVGSSPVGNR